LFTAADHLSLEEADEDEGVEEEEEGLEEPEDKGKHCQHIHTRTHKKRKKRPSLAVGSALTVFFTVSITAKP
jgi:hypothetical protein